MSAPLAYRSILVLAALSTAPLAAQSSTTIDASGIGCQSGGALLTGGVAASADITVDYDPATGVLLLTVDNTSPVVSGEATPVITRVYLNLPEDAIDSAGLVGQTGSGGAAPAFTLSFDADTSAGPNPNSAGCLGDFNLCLATGGGASGGIANPAATVVAAPSPVLGPVTFEIQLGGPGAGGITSDAILASFSNERSPRRSVTVGVKFQAGGAGGAQSGFLASGEECPTAIYVLGTPAIGNTIDICVTGGNGCHACPWVSLFQGPTVVPNGTIPLGLPLLAVFTLGDFVGTQQICLRNLTIPNDPSLSGLCLFWANLTHPFGDPTSISFSAPYKLTIQ